MYASNFMDSHNPNSCSENQLYTVTNSTTVVMHSLYLSVFGLHVGYFQSNALMNLQLLCPIT